MRIIEGTAVFGEPDEPTLAQIGTVAKQAERTVLCADAHVGYVMPIGGVAAYRNQVSVVGVGFSVDWTRARTCIAACPMCSRLRKARSRCWTRCGRSLWSWPARTSSICTRID